MEDSHVDNFYAYCSPSVLLRNKSWMLDESDVEGARGLTSRMQPNQTAEQFTLMENSQGYFEDELYYENKNSNEAAVTLSDAKRIPLILINESQQQTTTTTTTTNPQKRSTSTRVSTLRTLRLEDTFSCNDPKKLADWIANSIEEESNKENSLNTSERFLQKRLEFIDATPKIETDKDLTASQSFDENSEMLKSFSFLDITK